MSMHATGTGSGQDPQFEVVIIGAGVAGIYQLYRLVELGVHTTVLEGAAGLGEIGRASCRERV